MKVINRINGSLLIAWSIVTCILILSLLPGNRMPRFGYLDILSIDKLGHATFYGSACFFFFKGSKKTFKNTTYIIIGGLFFLGISLEFLQSILASGRVFDYLDQFANSIGIGLGYLIYNRFMQPPLNVRENSKQLN